MLRCSEVVRLYSTDEVHEAPRLQRVTVRIHLMMCRHCRRYVQELSAIGDAFRHMAFSTPDDPEQIEGLVRRILPDTREHGEPAE